MSSTEVAKDKAARLLKKRGSISSSTSNEHQLRQHRKQGSMSTISFMEDPGNEPYRPPVRMENTYQMDPKKSFPVCKVRTVIGDVLQAYLAEEKYEPELCRQMTKTLSEVVKARVKEMMIPRFKIVCMIHIGQLKEQSMRIGSRCLWDPTNDSFASFEFRNNSLFAIGTVYGIYAE